MYISQLNSNKGITIFWAQDSMEYSLVINDGIKTIELQQENDIIYINKEFIPELIKVLKQYNK